MFEPQTTIKSEAPKNSFCDQEDWTMRVFILPHKRNDENTLQSLTSLKEWFKCHLTERTEYQWKVIAVESCSRLRREKVKQLESFFIIFCVISKIVIIFLCQSRNQEMCKVWLKILSSRVVVGQLIKKSILWSNLKLKTPFKLFSPSIMDQSRWIELQFVSEQCLLIFGSQLNSSKESSVCSVSFLCSSVLQATPLNISLFSFFFFTVENCATFLILTDHLFYFRLASNFFLRHLEWCFWTRDHLWSP